MGKNTVVLRPKTEDQQVESLICQIETQWGDLQIAWRNAVARAVALGKPLAELKRLAPKRWHDVLDRFAIPEPTANLAIRLHDNRRIVLAEVEKNPNLTFKAARALLPRERAPGGGRKTSQQKVLEATAELKGLEGSPKAPKRTEQAAGGQTDSESINKPEEGSEMGSDGCTLPEEDRIQGSQSRLVKHPSEPNPQDAAIAAGPPEPVPEEHDPGLLEKPAWWDMAAAKAFEEGERFKALKRQGLMITDIAEKEALEPQFIRNCLQCLHLPKDLLVECTLGEAIEERRRREKVIDEAIENARSGSEITPEVTIIPRERRPASEGLYEQRVGMHDAQNTASEESIQAKFADACWVAEDITSKYDCTTTQAEEWLQRMDCKLRDHMIEAGWEYIDVTCPFEPKDDDLIDEG